MRHTNSNPQMGTWNRPLNIPTSNPLTGPMQGSASDPMNNEGWTRPAGKSLMQSMREYQGFWKPVDLRKQNSLRKKSA